MKARYAHQPARIDTGLRYSNGPGSPRSPRSPQHTSRNQDAKARRSNYSDLDLTTAQSKTTGSCSPRAEQRLTNVSSVRDEKEFRRQAQSLKFAVQREMKATSQVLKRTSANKKRLHSQKQQLDEQLQRTAREQERSILKREEVLRSLQAKDRSLDENLLSSAKEEGELVERLTYLKRQLEQHKTLLSGKDEDAMNRLRAENKRLRNQVSKLMANTSLQSGDSFCEQNTTASNGTPLQHPTMMTSEDASRIVSPQVQFAGAPMGMMAHPGVAQPAMYPGMMQPGVVHPNMVHPGMQPGMVPAMGYPSMAYPIAPRPGMVPMPHPGMVPVIPRGMVMVQPGMNGMHPMAAPVAQPMAPPMAQHIPPGALSRSTSSQSEQSQPSEQRQDSYPRHSNRRFAPPPRVMSNVRSAPISTARSLSPDLFARSYRVVPRKQLNPPSNLAVRMVSSGQIAVPTMPRLPTMNLETPREKLMDDTPVDLRSAVRRHLSVPPRVQREASATEGRSVFRGISPAVSPRVDARAISKALSVSALVSPRLPERLLSSARSEAVIHSARQGQLSTIPSLNASTAAL